MPIYNKNNRINNRIKELRLLAKYNQKDFSSIIGVDNSQYSKIERGVLMPTLEHLMEISSKLNISLDWLILGKESDGSTIIDNRPIIEINPEAKTNTLIADVKASAGFGSILDNPEKLESLPSISLLNAPYGLNVAFQITGDSMHPTIRHLDYVAGNKVEDFNDIRDGYVYIVIDKDDGALCKRLYHQGNDIQIVSDNPSYSPYSRTRNDLLGVFRAFCRLSFDFRTYHNDLRNDIQQLRQDVEWLKRKVK